jgi:hypothetical protein
MDCVRKSETAAAATHPEGMQRSGWRASDEPSHQLELMTQIVAVERHRSGYLVAQPNCRLDDPRVIWSSARLANRTSRKGSRMCLLVRRPSTTDLADATDVVVAYLPSDLRMGDILAIAARVPAPIAQPERRLG